jgi:hypothetical protein
MEGTRKRGRPCKRWKDEVEKELNIVGIKNGQAMAKHRREWRKIVLETNIYRREKEREEGGAEEEQE